eukprot:GEMP01003905.1.p1 GENE.GEMP01003905.1~~GEMP01003905.1.p1  ORF type:complete len:933 (+),score=231.91 GEMP01003905.1:303-3101(+)
MASLSFSAMQRKPAGQSETSASFAGPGALGSGSRVSTSTQKTTHSSREERLTTQKSIGLSRARNTTRSNRHSQVGSHSDGRKSCISQAPKATSVRSNLKKDFDRFIEQLERNNNVSPVMASVQSAFNELAANVEGTTRDKATALLETENLDTFIALNELFDQLGCYACSENICAKRLAWCQSHFDANHVHTLDARDDLGVAQANDHQLPQSDETLYQCLLGREIAFGKTHESTLRTCNLLGRTYYLEGLYSDAEEMHRRALGMATEEDSVNPLGAGMLRKNIATTSPDNSAASNKGNATYKADLAVSIMHSKPLDAKRWAHAAVDEAKEGTLERDSAHLTLADVMEHLGDLDETEKLYRTVLTQRTKTKGPNHPETITTLQRLAHVLQQLRKNEEAEQLHVDMHERWVQTRGANHHCALAAMNDIGVFYTSTQPLTENGEQYLRKAYDGYCRLYGPHSQRALETGENLADAYVRQQKFIDAEGQYRKVLAGRIEVFGSECVPSLKTSNDLATVLQTNNKLDEAEALFKDAVAGWRKVSAAQANGQEHTEALLVLNNLATLYLVMGRLQECETCYRRVLDGWSKQLGPDHPDTLFAMNNVGLALKDQRKLKEAEKYYRQCLEARLRTLGSEDPEVFESYINLAVCLKLGESYDEALKYHNLAYSGRVKILGPFHRDTLQSMYHIGFLNIAVDRIDQAIQWLTQCKEASEEHLGTEHSDTLNAYNALAIVLSNHRPEESEKVEELYRKAISGLCKIFGPTNIETLRPIFNLATFLFANGSHDSAEGYYRRALDGYMKELGPSHPNTLQIAHNLATCLEAQEKFDEAEKYYKFCREAKAEYDERKRAHPDSIAEDYEFHMQKVVDCESSRGLGIALYNIPYMPRFLISMFNRVVQSSFIAKVEVMYEKVHELIVGRREIVGGYTDGEFGAQRNTV